MRYLFIILSIAYIAGIFLLANSSIVSDLSTFNPYSILHIPLYGILTALLILSIAPMKLRVNGSDDSRNPLNSSNPSNPSNPITPKTHLLLPGSIACIVAIADEIHQAYVPGRDASVADVLLDFIGIALVLFFAFRLLKARTSFVH